MIRALALLLIVTPPLLGQAEAMRIVHADAARLPNAEDYRYLLKPEQWTEKEWAKYLPAIVGHLHQISRTPVHYKLGTQDMLAIGPVLRVNVYKLGYREVWDRLKDPYLTRQVWYGKYDHTKKWVWTHSKTAPAQILMENKEDEKLLNNILGWTYSQAAMVRADWFCNQTLAASNRDPGYPEFLGYKDKAEFEKMGGFERKSARAFRFERRESVTESGVTVQRERAFALWESLGGGYLYSIDFKKDSPALDELGEGVELKADGFEAYIVLPSGFWAVAGFDGKGNLVRAVPGDIASDSFSKSTNKQVEIGISCIRCHGEGGLREIKPFFRDTLTPPLKGILTDTDKTRLKKQALELEQQYQADIKGFLERAKLSYNLSVLACTGLKSGEFAKLLTEMWERYEDARVGTAHVAKDNGLTEEEFRERLLLAIKVGVKDAYGEYLPIPTKIGALVHKGDKAVFYGIREYERFATRVNEIVRATK